MNSDCFRVLVVEDDEDYARLLSYRLTNQSGFALSFPNIEVEIVATAREAQTLIRKGEYDLVLLDLKLTDASGLQAFFMLTESRPTFPIIVLTGTGDSEFGIEAVQRGAQDFLLKGEVTTPLLLRSIRYAVERHQLQEQLRARYIGELQAREANLRNITTQTTDGIVVTDENGLSLFVNPVFLALVGRSEVACLDETFSFSLGQDGTFEVDLEDANGLIRTVEIKVNAIEWYGKPARLGTLRDVSERRAAEIASQQYSLELEAQNEDLDAFAHTVAHNLKAPLGMLLMATEVLEDAEQAHEEFCLMDYTRTIQESGATMSTIIDELLLLAEVRTLNESDLGVLDMPFLLQKACHRLKADLDERNITIEWAQPGHEWPCALGHAAWVEEVWANYVSNAIKYSGRPPSLTVGASAEEPEMVRFWIQDNGAGLTLAAQEKLFSPFSRLGDDVHDGHGLGLSIVRRIVEKLGGQFGVCSSPGKGSTFSFTLPAAPSV